MLRQWSSTCSYCSLSSKQEVYVLWKIAFIVNLIAFDLACAVTFIGIVIYWYLYLTILQRITACFCIITLLTYITTGQFASFMAMAIDRYIKIVHPFTHIKICTQIYVFWILLVVHLVSAAGAVGLGLYFTWDPEDACFFTYTFSQSALTIYQVNTFSRPPYNTDTQCKAFNCI